MLKSNCRHNKSIYFTCIGLLVIFALTASIVLLKANEAQSGYQFHVVKNDDQTVDIVGDQSQLKEGVEITQITGPDGAVLNKDQVKYRVTKNDVYTFHIDYVLDSVNQSQTVNVQVNAFTENNIKTVGDLRMLKNADLATQPIPIKMYTAEMNDYIGDYQFPGGDITGIEDQTFQGLPYKFLRAEIQIYEGASLKTYEINYYDKIDGIFYYALANNSGEAQDFDIAYEAPAGSIVTFIYQLNTKEYPVTVNNDKVSEGFKVEYLTGFKQDASGNVSARYNTLAKVKLTYPSGYYTMNAPTGKKNVGIEFNDPTLKVDTTEDPDNRSITYTFTYPNKPLTMTVVGDANDTGLIYGVYDSTGNAQSAELGGSYWQATDAAGNYTEGQPYFGFPYGGGGQMIVRGGTSTSVQLEGQPDPVTIATDTFNSNQTLNFEYVFFRVNGNATPKYYYNPSPMLSVSYFSNGTDYNTGKPITETFPLWSPDLKYNPKDNPPPPIITNTYQLGNGAKITITIKKAVYGTYNKVNYPDFQAHITIENMKNSFYLSTGGISSVQGTHFFRDLRNTSLDSVNDVLDSYFVEDYQAENGGASGTVHQVGLKSGRVFIDKRAVYNQYLPDGKGVPWADANDVFFKFGITPKWGYTFPTIESYGTDGTTPIMTNTPIEIEKKEREANSQPTADLTLGNYSWFNPNQGRSDVSPFQYVMFMPVKSLTTIHDVRSIDVKEQPITGIVENNNDYTQTDPNNTIMEKGTFDLLDNDKIVFSKSFKPPDKPGYTFVGFTAEITVPENPIVPSYKKVMYKNTENTEYFRPGDVISISDYFRRDSKALLDAYTQNGTLSAPEQERLAFLMYSPKFHVKIVPQYKPGGSTEGGSVTGWVNKYLQDVTDPRLTYSATPVDKKSVSMINGTNIIFSSFAETYDNPNDHYTYYLNKDNTTSVTKVTADQQELAQVRYDRGLQVSYVNADKSPFTGLTDKTVYKTYAGNNQATIKFPIGTQCPLGKALDYWKVEEWDETGQWVPKTGVTIKEGASPSVYEFSSGPQGNDKSIRLIPVWKDISPDSYITIPKNINLFEDDTNLKPADQFAGAKVTITYHSVNNSDKAVNVDVLKAFDLTQMNNPANKIKVSSYDTHGQLLSTSGVNNSYARLGELNKTTSSMDFWFNTPSLDNNDVFKGTFQTSSDPSKVGQNTLFYISAVTP